MHSQEKKTIENPYLIPYLTHLYASKEGIFQMFNQFLYQYIVLEDKKLKEILKRLMQTEFNHLEIIGKILNKYQKYPVFATFLNYQEKYWNAYDLYYDQDNEIMFEIDECQKKKMIYNNHLFLNNMKDKSLKSIIKKILSEEYEQLKMIQTILKNEN